MNKIFPAVIAATCLVCAASAQQAQPLTPRGLKGAIGPGSHGLVGGHGNLAGTDVQSRLRQFTNRYRRTKRGASGSGSHLKTSSGMGAGSLGIRSLGLGGHGMMGGGVTSSAISKMARVHRTSQIAANMTPILPTLSVGAQGASTSVIAKSMALSRVATRGTGTRKRKLNLHFVSDADRAKAARALADKASTMKKKRSIAGLPAGVTPNSLGINPASLRGTLSTTDTSRKNSLPSIYSGVGGFGPATTNSSRNPLGRSGAQGGQSGQVKAGGQSNQGGSSGYGH